MQRSILEYRGYAVTSSWININKKKKKSRPNSCNFAIATADVWNGTPKSSDILMEDIWRNIFASIVMSLHELYRHIIETY